MSGRNIRNGIATLVLIASSRLPDSAVFEVLRYSALVYILGDTVIRPRAGYLRRLPHWTTESWRWYCAVAAVPVAALLVFLGLMMVHPAGAAHSTVRAVWVAVLLFLMLIGAVGTATAILWLAEGDATRQFTAFQRRRRVPPTAASGA